LSAAYSARQSGNGSLLLLAAAYLLFIVYGSLVPLDFRPRPFDEAWQAFQAIQYFALGVDSRADWIANGVLYFPLSYLLCAALGTPRRAPLTQVIHAALVFLFCAAVAVSVEFTQLFFPPRTVSLNDLIAEIIGSAAGIVVCLVWGETLERLRTQMTLGGAGAIRAVALIYLLAYLAASLFPYDFYISAAEFSQKLSSDAYGLFVAQATCDRLALCSVRLFAEMLFVVPLGLLLSITLGKAARHPYATAVWWGLALGFAMELTQLFMASGISQGISLFTRAAGLSLGVTLHRRLKVQRLVTLLPHIGPILALLCLPYFFALMWLNGWFSAGWRGVEHAGTSLDTVNWIPFYYHYYTTEQAALRSLLVNAAMVVPIGFGYWAWSIRHSSTYANGTALIPALIATPLAAILETGKLFVPGKHVDPTNVLIAAFAAAASYLFAVQVQRWSLQGTSKPANARTPVPAAPPAGQRRAAATLGVIGVRPLIAALLLAGVGWALLHYPLNSVWALLALVAYAALLWRFPRLTVPSVVALLPLLNFAPWSGWILVSELDLFIAVALAVRLLQAPPGGARVPLVRGSTWAIGLLAASYAISAAVGLLPWTPLDPNALVSYFGGLNSLRVLKGFAWALALLPLALADIQAVKQADQRLVAGLLIGLSIVVAAALWERAVFSGVLDFSSDYRLEGPFPELHTGGGDINAYLVMVIPFAVWWTTLRPGVLHIISGATLFALASYAMAVTFTRGGYVGYCGALLVLTMTAALHGLRARNKSATTTIMVAGLAIVGLAVILAIAASPFMETRLAASKTDAGTRTAHWQSAYDMMEPNLSTTLFGMGLGSFPATLLVKARESASATFSYPSDSGNRFLQLGSGRPLYVDQRITAPGGKRLTLSLDLRSRDPKASVGVSLCEKSLQTSFACEQLAFSVDTPGPAWKHKEATLNTDQLGTQHGILQRPIVLALVNSQNNSVVDVDNIRLIDDSGRDLIANGDFTQGGAHWYFSADDHKPWHIFNLWVQILFEQGVFGVLAFVTLAGISLAHLARQTWAGDWFSGSLLASLGGFLLLGFTESLFDGPRVTTLFFLLLFLGLRRMPSGASAARQ
jgi:VanZ family protein